MAEIELDLLDWLHGRKSQAPSVELGIGDDMAAITLPESRILVGSDMILDGVHFDSSKHAPERIGRKAMACCLSDCAAMAVRPLAAVVSVALPNGIDLAWVKKMFDGMFAMGSEFATEIVGGDTTTWNHPFAIDVAMTALPYPGIEPIRRRGAKVGDGIFVTGPLGGSILGRHLNFTPRVREAHRLATLLGPHLHAMMDISDGLSLDLWRLCRASSVGAILEEALFTKVISDDARKLSAIDGRAPLDHALSDGEDFELLVVAAAAKDAPVDVPLYRVGTISPSGLAIARTDGRIEDLQPRGYVHG